MATEYPCHRSTFLSFRSSLSQILCVTISWHVHPLTVVEWPHVSLHRAIWLKSRQVSPCEGPFSLELLGSVLEPALDEHLIHRLNQVIEKFDDFWAAYRQCRVRSSLCLQFWYISST